MDTDADTLHNIDTRLALVEAELRSMAGIRKIILGQAAILLLMAAGGIIGFTEMRTEFRSLNLTNIETNMTSTRVVLVGHSSELEAIRAENARLRVNIDTLRTADVRIREYVAEQTKGRFYKEDGDKLKEYDNKLDSRVTRLEDLFIKRSWSGNGQNSY